MKKPVKASVNKMIERFDSELKTVLLNEIKAMRTRNFLNAIKDSMNNSRLSAA